jgi:hypothetical protein
MLRRLLTARVLLLQVVAHAGGCFCLDLHPSGRLVAWILQILSGWASWSHVCPVYCRYLALGGLDSLVSIWDLEELYCVRTIVITT